MSNTKLTPKQQMFVVEYLVDLNATKAAMRAGYSDNEKSAGVQGSRLLENVKIKAAIETAMAERGKRTEITGDTVLKRINTYADFDPAEFYNQNGKLKSIHDIPLEVRKCIKSIKIFEEFEGFGQDRKQIGETVEVTWLDRLKANELLGRHHKLFTDKIEIEDKTAISERIRRARARAQKK